MTAGKAVLPILAMAAVFAVPAGVPAQAPAGHAGHGAAAGGAGGPGAGGRVMATLLVEISAVEGALGVAQALYLAGGTEGTWTLPLLLPESGPLPLLRERVGEEDAGLQIRGRGGADVRLEGGRVVVRGKPVGAGEFAAEVQYQLPVTGEPLVLAATPGMDLTRVQVIHRGGPHALQVRPLAPFAFRQEDEGDGTWRYQDLTATVAAGTPLRVAVGRVPSTSGPVRAAALAVLGVVLAGALVLAARRRT